MPRYKVPLTKIIFAVLIGICEVNSDIFGGPWPYEKPTWNPESGNQRYFIGSTYSWWTIFRTFLSSFWKPAKNILQSQIWACWESTRCDTYTHNSLKRSFRQPLCDPRYLRKLDERENQRLDDFLDYRQRPWGISRGVTDQQSTRFQSN